MKTLSARTLARCCALATPLLLVPTHGHAQAQSWEYKAYVRDPASGLYNKEKFNAATITVEETGGKATFRMVSPGRGDACVNHGELPAEVERNAETVTITVKPQLSGCEPFRYVIKNDGSGGVRMNLRNERWVKDGFDHGLTPKQ
jgi:hypothetical protein